MTRRAGREPAVPWSNHDTAIWHTVRAVDAVRSRRPDLLPRVMSPFRPHLAEGELMLAQGDFQLLTFRAVGDGSYQQSSGFFFATGGVGLAATAAFALAQGSGNRRRRQEAAAMAAPRWVVDDGGAFWVSLAGFYLSTAHGLNAWPWGSIHSAQLTAPGSLHVQGQSTHGPVSWILRSDWAELAFVCWALSQHPEHPQLLGRTWVPPGWDERDRQRGAAQTAQTAQGGPTRATGEPRGIGP